MDHGVGTGEGELCVCMCVCMWEGGIDAYPHMYMYLVSIYTYLIIVVWEAVVVGRDGRDKLGTGVSKHVLKDLLLSLLQSSHLVLKPLLQLRVDSFIYMLTSEKIKIIQYFMLTLHITATCKKSPFTTSCGGNSDSL